MNEKVVDLLIFTGEVNSSAMSLTRSTGSEPESLGMKTIGAAKVAWIARRHGYSALAVSRTQTIPTEELYAICKHFVGPNTIIGVSTSFGSFYNAPFKRTDTTDPRRNFHVGGGTYNEQMVDRMVAIVNKLRLLYNNKVLVGGPDAENSKQRFDADYVIAGPAENELPKLLDKLNRNGIQKKPYDWDITHCDFKWDDTDFIQPNEPIPLEIARGCIFKCKFCSYDQIGKKAGTFEKPMEHIRQELLYNYQRFGTTHYYLTSDTLNDDNERMNAFCDMLENLPFQIKFTGFVRMDLFHRFQDTARRLQENGLTGCSIGLETFHPQASKAIGKAFNGKHGKDFLLHLYKNIFKENVRITTTNIVSLPYESEEHSIESAKWYRDVGVINAVFVPLRLCDPARVPPYTMLSEFDKTFTKYGYSFPDPNDARAWVKQDSSLAKSIDTANYINREILNYKNNPMIYDGWSCLTYLNASGISHKQASEQGLDRFVIRQQSALHQIKNNYFKQLHDYATN